jgi:hypothetical protein
MSGMLSGTPRILADCPKMASQAASIDVAAAVITLDAALPPQ